MNGKTYAKYVDGRAIKSPLLKDCSVAFLMGGIICTIGEVFRQLYDRLGMSKDNAGMMTSVTLVFIAVLLTGLGVFDNIAKLAGGGTLVPITGFANAVSAAAIDNNSEGFILGVGAKIFTIAGPVILYGISAGVIYGGIYYVTTQII